MLQEREVGVVHGGINPSFRAEPRRAGDGEQPALVPRFSCSPRLTPGVRHQVSAEWKAMR
jgi:hypothetical protein